MIRVYCKFCLKLVDTLEIKPQYETVMSVMVTCIECKKVIGYTI